MSREAITQLLFEGRRGIPANCGTAALCVIVDNPTRESLRLAFYNTGTCIEIAQLAIRDLSLREPDRAHILVIPDDEGETPSHFIRAAYYMEKLPDFSLQFRGAVGAGIWYRVDLETKLSEGHYIGIYSLRKKGRSALIIDTDTNKNPDQYFSSPHHFSPRHPNPYFREVSANRLDQIIAHEAADDDYPFIGVVSLPISQITAFTDLSQADYRGLLRDIHKWWSQHQYDSQTLHLDEIPALHFSPYAKLGITKQQWRNMRRMWVPPYDD